MTIDEDTARRLVSRVPRTTAEIYREYMGLPPDYKVTISHRRARQRLGKTLEWLARKGEIIREAQVDGDRQLVCFRTLDSTAPVREHS